MRSLITDIIGRPDIISKFKDDTAEEVIFDLRYERYADFYQRSRWEVVEIIAPAKRTVVAKTKDQERGWHVSELKGSVTEAKILRER